MASKKETKIKKVTAKKSIGKGSKKIHPKPAPLVAEEKDEENELILEKGGIKKPLEIDAADILPEADDKIDEEAATLALEDEDAEDGPSLDAEDLNPFGDKWEI